MTHTSPADGGVSGACPDLDTLADLHAGVLDATTASTLRRHVDECSDCTAVLDALDATRTSLGSLPSVQIPPDVAARIDSALAAEAGRADLSGGTTTSRAASPPPAPHSNRPLRAVPSGDRRLGAAPDGEVRRSTAPTGGNGTPTSLAAYRQRRGRLLLAAAAAVVVGGGAVLLTQNSDPGANQAAQPQAESRLDVQAFAAPKDVLEEGAIEDEQISEEVAGKMAEKSARAQCLNQIVPRPASAPEAVQQGVHDGDKAYAFVFATEDEDIVKMIIVDASDCARTLDTVTGPRE